MSSLRDAQQSEWTVARSFRLLRPIVSRKSAARQRAEDLSSRRVARSQIVSATARAKFGDSPNPRLDPDWMSKPGKFAPRQYTRLISSSSADPAVDASSGALSIPTPLIRRTLRGPSLEEASHVLSHTSSHSAVRDIFTEKFVSQADEVTFRSQKIVRGTLDLIEATNTCASADAQHSFFPARGARSLRSMCCRKYARQIVVLEHEQQTSRTEEKFDVASEAYELLEETFGPGCGEYLRATTREYGVALFEQMMMASQIPRDHAIALIRRMTSPSRADHPSSAEVESISCILLQAPVPDKPCCGRNNAYANMLNSVAQISSQLYNESRSAFEFRLFEHLSNTSMPLCWLGTRRLTELWANVFRVFFETNHSAGGLPTSIRDVSRFLRTVVSLDCGLQAPLQSVVDVVDSSIIPDYHGNTLGCPKCPKPSHAASFLNAPKSQQPHSATNNLASRRRMFSTLSNSISSLYAILASIVVAAQNAPDDLSYLPSSSIMTMLGCLSGDIIEAVNSSDNQADASSYGRSVSILAATLVIFLNPTSEPGAVSANDLIRAMEVLDRKAQLNKGRHESPLASLPEFVFAITQSVAKIQRKESWKVLESLSIAMTSEAIFIRCTPSTRIFLIELAISSVELYAERTESTQASDQATRLRRTHHDSRRHDYGVATPFKPTPRPDRARDGLTWEDGLSEWIEAVPVQSQLIEGSETDYRESFQYKIWGPSKRMMGKEIRKAPFVVCPESDELDHHDFGLEQYSSSPSHHEQHDSGISGVLLSPKSPFSPTKSSLELSRLKNEKTHHQDVELPARQIVSAELQSLARTDQYPVQQKPKFNSQKRPFNDAAESDSEDELWIPGPRKKYRSHSAKQDSPPRTFDVGYSGAENEPKDGFDLHESNMSCGAPPNSSKQKSIARRRPRGNVLRSVSGRHATTRRPRCAGQGMGSSLDSEDELHDILA